MQSPSAASHHFRARQHHVRVRIANACDVCKRRKVKCDGLLPCGYCTHRLLAHACRFSAPRVPQRPPRQRAPSSPSVTTTRTRTTPAAAAGGPEPAAASSTTTPLSAASDAPLRRSPSGGGGGSRSRGHDAAAEAAAEEEADVPREARLVCDAQGKLIFIGDCAPLSLFQTVRQIVTSRVDAAAFAPQTSHISMLENAASDRPVSQHARAPVLDPRALRRLVSVFVSVTSALVELFDNARLDDEITSWASQSARPPDIMSAVYYLVLAIGAQSGDEAAASGFFLYGKSLAFSSLDGNLSVGTVQAFTLITLYMLRACQINGAFLFFGIAVRTAYSIGVHRTEVNSRFGAETHIQRDRLWKSLRVLDLFLSISMGRPPATSDADCTVSYHCADDDESGEVDLLNASVQIFLIGEGIVVEVYSRRKITLQLTDGISRQLREWSGRWLSPLRHIISEAPRHSSAVVVGACQVLSSYYYAVMLVSRPFLMYELVTRLPESPTSGPRPRSEGTTGRSRLANACIDAASLMVETIADLAARDMLDSRMPLIVSWLFAASLVVGVGLLGGFGRALEKHARMSITALDHFAEHDAHAMQYSLIAGTLLTSALEYLDRREAEERERTTEDSSQLFGLVPRGQAAREPIRTAAHRSDSQASGAPEAREDGVTPISGPGAAAWPAPNSGDVDPSIFSLTGSIVDLFPGAETSAQDQADEAWGAYNLFPLLDVNGHIDLAHYM
ncbi:hypothetical protein GGR56DRAFT_434689 [Xylariaceae sp. FL0804]|nr:hypothetical protein GGR56DRAFT_434689 [Xylariaceae sp. FL0804]